MTEKSTQASPPEYDAANCSTEPCRSAYSREEMIEEAKAYMRETWGPCREAEDRDRWLEHLGMLVDFIHDRFPSNMVVSGAAAISKRFHLPWGSAHFAPERLNQPAKVRADRCRERV